MSKIVVVMTCHNRREKTTGCLEKLHEGNNNNEYHYIVVDAGSTDGTCEEIEKIQTTLGTYGHLYPNTNIEIAKKLTGVLSYQSASQSIANYTSNQHTAMYHKEI